VKADAGRWWGSRRIVMGVRGNGLLDFCPLVYGNLADGWRVLHASTGDEVGGTWPDESAAKLWLWLALGIVPWHLVPDVATARQEWGSELDRMEARLRAVVGARTAGGEGE
jgi:hypothetical protein